MITEEAMDVWRPKEQKKREKDGEIEEERKELRNEFEILVQ